MIVVSLSLILVAVALLVAGLASGSSTVLTGSIGASALAAVALVVHRRRAAASALVRVAPPLAVGDDGGAREAAEDDADRAQPSRRGDVARVRSARPDGGSAAVAGVGSGLVTGSGPGHPLIPGSSARIAFVDPVLAPASVTGDQGAERSRYQGRAVPLSKRPARPGAALDADDPFDEPAPQWIEPHEADRVARMTAPVVVVDGRPRYHLAHCPHLVGRVSEAVAVAEAVRLGFSPCGRCEPVRALLAGRD